MHSSDSQENDRKKRLPGWEKEEASDDLLSDKAKSKLYDYQVPEEESEHTDKGE